MYYNTVNRFNTEWKVIKMIEKIIKETEGVYEFAVESRRELHKMPETAYNEVKTAKFIKDRLDELGIEYRSGLAGTGIVGRIHGNGKRCIAVRADMDALNINEETSLPYASCNPGKMHACGHDMHMAILLGTAALLKKMEKENEY